MMRDLPGWNERWRGVAIKAWRRLTISNGARVLKVVSALSPRVMMVAKRTATLTPRVGLLPQPAGEARSEAIEPSRWLHSAKAGIIEGWLAKIRLPPPG